MIYLRVSNGLTRNLSGQRQPSVFGQTILADTKKGCAGHAGGIDVPAVCLQYNHDGTLIDVAHFAQDIHLSPVSMGHPSGSVAQDGNRAIENQNRHWGD